MIYAKRALSHMPKELRALSLTPKEVEGERKRWKERGMCGGREGGRDKGREGGREEGRE